MIRKAFISSLILLVLETSGAQVASHAPTSVRQPAPNASGLVPLESFGKPVVRVNAAVLTDIDLAREEYSIFPYAKQHGGLPKDMAPQIRDGALKMIIFEELVYQEAQRRHLTVTPARMQRAEADFRKQFPNPAEFNDLVKTEFHGSMDQFREKIRRSLLIDQLLKAEVDAKCVPTPAEVRAFYDKNTPRYTQGETYTFQTISVLPPANATPQQIKEAKARAEAAYTKAKAAKTAMEFGLLAEKLSDDDYRVMLGQHKPTPATDIGPQVLAAFKTMKPGDITPLMQLDQNYTIVRLNAHTPAGKMKFETVRAQIQKDLKEGKRNQLRSALNTRLHQGAKVEIL
jgi:parvulin-like peptidyl-prolyl isomerase